MNNKTIEISVLEHRLVLRNGSKEIKSFPIATGKYPKQPKYWGWDYKTPIGDYFVGEVHKPGSEKLSALNSKFFPWYMTNKARDEHEDAGFGVYGEGLIVLNYPNVSDRYRFFDVERKGKLKGLWEEFCETHWKPIYEYIAQEQRDDFDKVVVDGDFGPKTYKELVEDVPDSEKAFRAKAGIHGTNDPDCIGTNISGGCIRMHNQDIGELIENITVRTPVVISLE